MNDLGQNQIDRALEMPAWSCGSHWCTIEIKFSICSWSATHALSVYSTSLYTSATFKAGVHKWVVLIDNWIQVSQ